MFGKNLYWKDIRRKLLNFYWFLVLVNIDQNIKDFVIIMKIIDLININSNSIIIIILKEYYYLLVENFLEKQMKYLIQKLMEVLYQMVIINNYIKGVVNINNLVVHLAIIKNFVDFKINLVKQTD